MRKKYFLDKSIKWAKQREDDTENLSAYVHEKPFAHNQPSITSHGRARTETSVTINQKHLRNHHLYRLAQKVLFVYEKQ